MREEFHFRISRIYGKTREYVSIGKLSNGLEKTAAFGYLVYDHASPLNFELIGLRQGLLLGVSLLI